MWYIEEREACHSSFKSVSKNHPGEYGACFSNLNKILTILKSGYKIGGFKIGFFRSEGDGLYRIGQTGVRSPKEVRLYVYPDTEGEIMYILSIGTKESQKNDIKEAKKKIKEIKGTKKENV